MKIFIYPVMDYVCAECDYHMLVEKNPIHKDLSMKKRTVRCVNERCKNYNKLAIVEAQEVELKEPGK